MKFVVAEKLLKPGQNEEIKAGAVEANKDTRQGHVFPLSNMQQTYLAGRSTLFDLHTKSHIYFEFDLSEIDVGRLGAAWHRLVSRHTIYSGGVTRRSRRHQILKKQATCIIFL